MSPVKHTAVSALTSAAFYGVTGSWTAAIVCFLSGIFIDVDHILEYYLVKGRFTCSCKKISEVCSSRTTKHLYLFLHSYELVALLWIIGF